MKEYSRMNDSARDVLGEIGNIGTGNAVTALSAMIGRDIRMELPDIRIVSFNGVESMIGSLEDVQMGILLTVSGDLNGMFMFLLSEEFAGIMLTQLLGTPVEELSKIDEMAKSAVCEIGNIMCGSYVNALSKMMNLRVEVSVPDMCTDMVGAILSVPMIHFANLSDELLFIENKFNLSNVSVISHVLFLPEPDSLKRIFEALGEDYEG